LAANVGSSVTSTLATVSGGDGKTASDYAATADFLDGKGPQPATLTKTALGTWTVSAPHTFTESGQYSISVTAGDGKSQVNAIVPISISRDGTLTGAFDSNCIGDPGVGANCDSKGWAFNRALLANSGFVQGTTVKVPGTDLTFDLPAVAAGNRTTRPETARSYV
jgi:hypothetical protein